MKNWKTPLGIALLMGLMAWTGYTLFHGQSAQAIWAALSTVHPLTIVAGLGLMTAFMACEATCTRAILAALGHNVPLRQAMGYSAAGFYFSSVTPSAAGGQPAQVFAMKRNGIPLAHGTLDMLLVTICYQTATLLFAGAAWVFLPGARVWLGQGLTVLLLGGGAVTLALTAGMAFLLIRPPKGDRFEGYRAAAALLRQKPHLLPKLFGLSCLQLLSLYLVPYVVYLGFGLSGQSALALVGTQALLSLATGCLPLPGAVGAAEGAFLKGFSSFFGPELLTPAVLVSRGISFYLPLLLTGLVALAGQIRLRRPAVEKAPTSLPPVRVPKADAA